LFFWTNPTIYVNSIGVGAPKTKKFPENLGDFTWTRVFLSHIRLSVKLFGFVINCVVAIMITVFIEIQPVNYEI